MSLLFERERRRYLPERKNTKRHVQKRKEEEAEFNFSNTNVIFHFLFFKRKLTLFVENIWG